MEDILSAAEEHLGSVVRPETHRNWAIFWYPFRGDEDRPCRTGRTLPKKDKPCYRTRAQMVLLSSEKGPKAQEIAQIVRESQHIFDPLERRLVDHKTTAF